MGRKHRSILDERLKKINDELRAIGVNSPLRKVGNYKNGEFEIIEIAHYFNLSKFIIVVIFKVYAPDGKVVDYVCYFDRNYSDEALHGHIIVPIVNEKYFLLQYSYAPFIGRRVLVLPRGFVPAGNPTMEETQKDVEKRRILPAFEGYENYNSVIEPVKLNNGTFGTIVVDSSKSRNEVTLSVAHISIDQEDFSKKLNTREFILVTKDELKELICAGKICDEHTLSAWALYSALF